MAESLTEIAIRRGTDKWGLHFYTPHYERHLQHLRHEKIHLLEIGVGGYNDPKKGGESLRMWKDFFANGTISGIDIFDKRPHIEDRVRVFQGSQIDEPFLNQVLEQTPEPDVIIDDGSHINTHNIRTFEILFPCLKPNGIYIVEDLQTSYWKGFGGDSFNLQGSKTAMNYFKALLDGLNYQEIDNAYFKPTYFDKNIVAMTFYHNMVVIQKGENTEKSNWVVENRMPNPNRINRFKYGMRHAWSRLLFRGR